MKLLLSRQSIMKNPSSKWRSLVVGLVIFAATYFLVGAASTPQVKSNARATVPALAPGEKKVVLKDLGMA